MSQKAEKTVSKELKIVARPVITVDDAIKDSKKVSVLGVVKSLGEVSERGLISCLYILKTEKDRDLGYPFQVIGAVVNSRELLEDIRVLLYLGLLEVTEGRKLRLTSLGKELLDKLTEGQKQVLDELTKVVEEVKQRVLSEDNLLNIMTAGGRGRRRR
ncbi:MAG: hypothetical protein QXT76_03280 [Sulfolobales archaeon]